MREKAGRMNRESWREPLLFWRTKYRCSRSILEKPKSKKTTLRISTSNWSSTTSPCRESTGIWRSNSIALKNKTSMLRWPWSNSCHWRKPSSTVRKRMNWKRWAVKSWSLRNNYRKSKRCTHRQWTRDSESGLMTWLNSTKELVHS